MNSIEDKIFRFKKEHDGQTFEVRVISNPFLDKSSSHSYEYSFNNFTKSWKRRYHSYAFINGELKIFEYAQKIKDFFQSSYMNHLEELRQNIFDLKSTRGFTFKCFLREGFIDYEMEWFDDKKFKIFNADSTNVESRKLEILKMYDDFGLTLNDSVFEKMYKFKDIPTYDGKTLYDKYVYDNPSFKERFKMKDRDNKLNLLEV